MNMFAVVALAGAMLGGTSALSQSSRTDESMKNSVGKDFVLVHPGTMQVGVFKPGCLTLNAAGPRPGGANAPPRPKLDPREAWTPEDFAECEELVKRDQSDGFPVTISSPYYIGKYEVTQAQWQRVMGNNPSVFQGAKVTGDASKHPVENVTWVDAQLFVKKLNSMEHTSAYHLPSEFQWEYACRAGGAAQVSWPEIRQQAVQGIGGGFGAGATGGAAPPHDPPTAEVGSKQANAWGLYDMMGNVWEWVADPYNGKLFADPIPAKAGTNHVLKGAGFASDVKNTICATHGGGPGDRWDVGFRVEKDAK